MMKTELTCPKCGAIVEKYLNPKPTVDIVIHDRERGVEVFSLGVETKALETAKQAMDYAKENGYDTVLFDTAGRLHIDEELMQELSDIKAFVHPDDILLTVDAMTGPPYQG